MKATKFVSLANANKAELLQKSLSEARRVLSEPVSMNTVNYRQYSAIIAEKFPKGTKIARP